MTIILKFRTRAAHPRSGALTPLNLPDSRWHLSYGADGTVKLIFVNGTTLLLK